MSSPIALSDQDWAVRAFVFRHWIDTAHPPGVEECSHALSMSVADARASWHRLDQRHLLVLDQPGDRIRMAHPLSGVETGYRTRCAGKVYDANCPWDSLGISAMLDSDAELEGINGLTGDTVTYSIRDGKLVSDDLVVHFLLPLRKWYDDLVFT